VYAYAGQAPEITQQIVEMAMNASGSRGTARVLHVDGWGAYERHVDAEKHTVGKEHMQRIESKHINLRTRIKRLVRRMLCFAKSEHRHDVVIGLFINRYEFEVSV
jgi:IS1 family transposase